MSSERPQAAPLRLAIYSQDAPTRTDLVGLVALAADAADPELDALLADVARDALLVDGRLACADADWLMTLCGDGAGLGSHAEFVALTSVLRHARPAPAELVCFAAREIERVILTGERGVIGGLDGQPGRVTASDAASLREIVGAGRPDRALAEAMFDIAHATATASNDPDFEALFVETLRAYLTAQAPAGVSLDEFWAALSHDEAPQTPSLDALADAPYRDAAEATSARLEAAAKAPAPEARWALAQLSRGALSPAERRLLATLGESATATRRAA